MLALYHHPSSACSGKVRVVLAEKNLSFTSHVIDIFAGGQFDSAYLDMNPAGVVPTLVHDGRVVRESLVICEYLEEAFPLPSLVSVDPVQRARMRVWCKDVETFMSVAWPGTIFSINDRFEVQKLSDKALDDFYHAHPNQRLAYRKQAWTVNGIEDPDARTAILTCNKFFQKMEMQLSKSEWLGGNAYSLSDAETAPYLCLLDILGLARWWQDSFPRVSSCYDLVRARQSIQSAIFNEISSDSRASMMGRGSACWPALRGILATAEPYNGRSPWAMRAEAI